VLRFLCFISKSFLLFLIRALVLQWVLWGFITLGASSSYTTRCCLWVSKSCERPQESLYYPLVWAKISVWAWPSWSVKGGLGLKGPDSLWASQQVGQLCCVTEPWNKSGVSCVLAHCVCSCSSFPHHFMEELIISFWCVDFEKCPFQVYDFEPCGSSRTSHLQS
jgi:hypothetical protein